MRSLLLCLLAAFCLGSAHSASAAPESGKKVVGYYIGWARDARSFPPEKILLYVHGATYPSETAFDLPIEGASMMDLIAACGYDVYLVDIRGYGASTRPPEMNAPPAENAPTVTTEVAVRDFCQGRIAHYKVPRHIRFVDAFPMTVTGKIQKYKIRDAMKDQLGLVDQKTA